MATRRSTSRRSGGRRNRSANRAIEVIPAYIKRTIPYYEFLGEESLQQIEQQADWLLQEIGVEFRDDEFALQLWKEAGADVDGVRVRLPNGMARQLCSTIPSEFTQLARDPKHNVVIGGNNVVFAPNYGSPFIRDLDKGRRYGTLEDFQNLV